MKIALCLAGYFNSKKDLTSKGIDGFRHLTKHVFSKHDKVDVFIHSWDLENKKIIEDLYSPYIINSIFEEQIDFSSKEKFTAYPGYTSQRTIFSHLYSVQKSFELLINSQKNYDWVIKSRFDVGRINRNSSGPHNSSNPYAVQCINFNSSLDNDYFYLADWGYFDSEGPADMWFYSSQKNMSKFSKIYDIILNDMEPTSDMESWAGKDNGGIVNTIKCYKWFLIKEGLWDLKKPLPTYWE